MKSKLISFFSVLAGAALCSGCIPILIHAAVQSDSQEKAAYSAYCDTQAKINSDREIAGLSTNRVMTRVEWKTALGGSSTNRVGSPKGSP